MIFDAEYRREAYKRAIMRYIMLHGPADLPELTVLEARCGIHVFDLHGILEELVDGKYLMPQYMLNPHMLSPVDIVRLNCGKCRWLSLTEEQQDRAARDGERKRPHVCIRFDSILHHGDHLAHALGLISCCDECLAEQNAWYDTDYGGELIYEQFVE